MAVLTDIQIKHMVERFLGWRVPETFNPDNGVSFDPPADGPNRVALWPTGTNLFDYDQATEMVRHMVDELPETPTQGEA